MNAEPAKVADALPDSWVYRLLPQSVWPYAQLARWERPIGWWLLLWPCWWSVALATNLKNFLILTDERIIETYWPLINIPYLVTLFLFLIGAIAMRGAGCTYNDLIDRDLDARISRTASRPIASGRVSRARAVTFLIAQALVGFFVLYQLSLYPWLTGYWFNALASSPFSFGVFFLGIASLLVVALYPFAKRVTDWPQLVLGLAFSWGALMGWAVVFGSLSLAPILLYAGCILWVIGYDTIYAHQDREDDALVGVRSTARLFREKTKPALLLLYWGALFFFFLAYLQAGVGWPAFAGLAIGGMQMYWQITRLDIDDPDNCLRLFKSNSRFGWVVFGGLVADLFL